MFGTHVWLCVPMNPYIPHGLFTPPPTMHPQLILWGGGSSSVTTSKWPLLGGYPGPLPWPLPWQLPLPLLGGYPGQLPWWPLPWGVGGTHGPLPWGVPWSTSMTTSITTSGGGVPWSTSMMTTSMMVHFCGDHFWSTSMMTTSGGSHVTYPTMQFMLSLLSLLI